MVRPVSFLSLSIHQEINFDEESGALFEVKFFAVILSRLAVCHQSSRWFPVTKNATRSVVSSLSEMLMRGLARRGSLAGLTAAQIIWLLLPWKSYKGASVRARASLIADFSFL